MPQISRDVEICTSVGLNLASNIARTSSPPVNPSNCGNYPYNVVGMPITSEKSGPAAQAGPVCTLFRRIFRRFVIIIATARIVIFVA